MAIVDEKSLLVALYITSASPHEVTLVEQALGHRFTASLPRRLIGDKVYNSDALDKKLSSEVLNSMHPTASAGSGKPHKTGAN